LVQSLEQLQQEKDALEQSQEEKIQSLEQSHQTNITQLEQKIKLWFNP